MRKPLVAGNWKMNNPDESSTVLLENILEHAELLEQKLLQDEKSSAIDIAIFPPAVYLKDAQQILTGSHLHWGTQNVSAYDDGPYTGEISASMIKGFGCDYVLIGHSERRCLYDQLDLDQALLDQIVAQKYEMAIEHDLIPIICIGESAEDYKAGKTREVIARLLDVLIEHKGAETLAKTVLAYEPVWAIGTGESATPEWAQEIHAFMRQRIAQHDEASAEAIRIIYGGSVKPDNAQAIFSKPDVDGGLIGGASLDVEEFSQICLAATLLDETACSK
ncbi:MAG: triose-phosphate isomerase [Gammaproteobacteria bacterium]|nr:MAG: triose-phosphate isomerase [Gammaproteobacteria bacterium]